MTTHENETRGTTERDGPRLVVGPLLRFVDETSATVWVETDRPCEVSVLGRTARTWGVHGHYYALVVLDGLEPGTVTPYGVELDGTTAWPEPGSPLPPSVIRTYGGQAQGLRLAFGSCRRAAPFDRRSLRQVGADALVALAERMSGGEYQEWPDALLLVGDQVYADDPSPALKQRLRRLHDGEHPAGEDDEAREEIMDFEEYTWLYHESWRAPMVRWLLSSVPTCMILDDHDLRDDWNSSWSWRQEITQEPWWHDRVVGAFSSYWVYQHLGNLSPTELADDDLYEKMQSAGSDAEREKLLADFAVQADEHPDTARWSFHRDFGRTRLVVVDSRCSRELDPDNRRMVDAKEWDWVRQACDADVDHLLIGTSVPFLELHGIHHMEGWNEATAEGAWGRAYAKVAEKMRLAVDLEHWAAFRNSFDDMVDLARDVSRRPRPPASVLWLSGDVHCSYVSRARVSDGGQRTAMWQLTMSPFRNPLNVPIRIANRLFERKPVVALTRFLARRAGVTDPGIEWRVEGGPWFDNGVMTVVVDGREASVEVDHARAVGGAQVLERTHTRRLT